MTGRPSDVARTLTMAVTVYAKRRQRPVTILLYGNDEMDCFTVKNLRKQRKALVRFLSYDCGGGNNEEELFGTVFREILPQDTAFSSADILCVSDFLWPPLSEAVTGLILANKAKGMKFYGLDVTGSHPTSPVIDAMWIWDRRTHDARPADEKVGKG